MNTKKVFCWLLCISIIFSLLPHLTFLSHAELFSGYCGSEGENVTWSLDEETGILSIIGNGAMADYDNSNAPWNNYRNSIIRITISNGVTSIGKRAFTYCTNLNEVSLSPGLESIGDFAFLGSSIKSLSIPDSVHTIGSGAFRTCSFLKSIKLPSNITQISSELFYQCFSLDTISIPNNVVSIGNSAFLGSGLRSITLGQNVKTIKSWAFNNCSHLEGIVLPVSVSSIDAYAFMDCSSMEYIAIFNPSCSIYSLFNSLGPVSITTVYGYYGSTAESHANRFGYTFLPITSNFPSWYLNNIYMVNDELSITVYENTCNSKETDEDYRLLNNASVSYSGNDYLTDKSGHVQIKYFSGSVSVEKEGYVKRSFSDAALKRSTSFYLQKESDYPVISGLWMEDLDILHENAEVSMTGKTQYTLSTEIEWGQGTEASVKLIQGGNALDISGGTVSFAWSDYFDVSEPIYLIATNADGLTSKKKLKISAESQLPESLSGLSIEFGDSLSITLPDSVPEFFKGTEISAGIYSNIPIEYTVENGKVYAAIGFQKDFSQSNGKMKAKTFAKSLQDIFKDAVDGIDDYHIYQAAQKKYGGYATVVEGSFAVKTGFKIMGYAEGYLTPDGSVIWLDSGLIIGGNASVGYSLPFYIGPVPMFFEAQLSGSIEAKANLYIAPEAKQFMPNVSLSGEVALSAGLGVGIKKVASVSGGLKGSLKPRWDMSLGRTDFFQLKAKLKAYAKVAVLCFEYSKDWTLAESVWYEYPEKKCYPALSEPGAEKFAPYDLSSYQTQDLAYLAHGSTFDANRSELRGTNQLVWLTNSYNYASPQLVSFSDGTMLAVWIGMDETGTANGLRLFSSYFNGETWSEPQLVDPDQTMDAAPVLTVIDDTAYLTWQNASDDVSNVESLAALAEMIDISFAVFDQSNQSFSITRITDSNDTLDIASTVCGGENTIYVVWQRNEDNQWFGTENNCIVYRCCSNGVWQDEVIAYASLPSINSFAADYAAGSLSIAYSLDTDGNLNTTEDLEVYENGNQITENDSIDSGVQYFQNNLYWYQDGNIVTKDATVLEDVPTDRIQIVSDGRLTSIVYAKQDGLYSTLCAVYHDAESGNYGAPLALTDGSTNAVSFSAAVTNGKISVLWNSEEVLEDTTGDYHYGLCSIQYLENEAVCDLSVEDIYCDCSEYIFGADMTATLSVHNFGELTADGVTIIISDADGNELSKMNYEDVVLSGSTTEIHCGFRAAQEQYGKEISFTVLPLRKTDVNPDDNSISSNFTFRDIAVENMAYGFNEDGALVVFADVVNRSYENTSEVITVGIYKGSLDSAPLKTISINGLDSLSLQHAAFTVDASSLPTVYYIAISIDGGNEKRGNDSDYVFAKIENQDNPKPNPFEDIAEGKYYYTPVLWAYYHDPQITSGTSETTFGPKELCTRAEIVTFLWRAAGSPEPQTTASSFTDIQPGKYYYEAVLWAVENDITAGLSETTFGPNNSCTRSQAMTFLWRFAGSPEPESSETPFTDVKPRAYYSNAVLWAFENGVTSGTSDNTFSPETRCTRGQIITFLYRYLNQ